MQVALVVFAIIVTSVAISALYDVLYWFKHLIRHSRARADLNSCARDALRAVGVEDQDIHEAILRGELSEQQMVRYAAYLKTLYGVAIDIHIARTWPNVKAKLR